jgi:hypothetical protein
MTRRTAAVYLVLILIFGLEFVLFVLPIVTTHPSEGARRRWEQNYSFLLPPNCTDFRADWQNQDVGVHIFSFRCPGNMSGPDVLLYLLAKLSPGFKLVEQQKNELVVRRPVTYSNPMGFDEYRFIYSHDEHRIFGMFANLDDELSVHGELVDKLRQVVRQFR